ncbi:TIGR01777 family oxidoreductase [uncultured Desulfobulbus sp.]|uniref:TIGR01777 family oxidoreductase n=1 Tax=uncultured Desulfobulbus sp. TaxID=239745 RepID=UPI0029C70E6B|nr:TIGR01777 family oxidoreductase [uncultured Desulfobulbus sp.]
MTDSQFTYSSLFPCLANELYDWHRRPGALERLIPPWEQTRVAARSGGIDPGGRVVLAMHAGPIPYQWHARHIENLPGLMFRDIQDRGPFARWTHTHRFADTPNGALLEDQIDYALPGQAILPGLATGLVDRTLTRVFRYRHATLRDDIALHQRCSSRPLRVLISGASGVLGSALRPLLTTGGHEVWTLVRRPPDRSRREIYWNPERDQLNLAGLPAFDGVIHLAGDNIGDGRWTLDKKKRVIDSRVQGTGLIARTLAGLPVQPKVFLSASAVGFYGNCLDCCMREEDRAGTDFISDVCTLWEHSARPAEEAGIRTVFLRIGVVLSPQGGALQRLLATSAIGFSSRFGAGDQYISWIGINDMVGVVLHALTCDTLTGPVNIAAPQPATNSQLMRTLAQVLRRPLLPPIPASLLQTLYGQMASEVLLGGCRVATDKLQQSGYTFRHADLEQALRHLLGRFENNGPEC